MLLAALTIVEYIVDTPKGPETLRFTFPGQTDPDFQTAKKKFLDSRIVQRGRRMVNRSNQARIDFFDKHCSDVQLLEEMVDGKPVNIMGSPGWNQKVDVVIKVSIVAQAFEEKETLSPEDEEDLQQASDED